MAKLTQPDYQSDTNASKAPGGLLQELLSKQITGQFIKYVITGLVSFTTEISLVYLFTEVVKLWYIYSNSMALLAVFIINFSLNRFWAFRSRQPFVKQLIMSGTLFFLNLVAGNAIMYFFTETIRLYYLFSKVIATGMAVTWNFLLYKYYIYK
jgi:putative flippase GtrA